MNVVDWKINPETRQKLLDNLSESEYITTVDLAAKMHETIRGVQRKLCIIHRDERSPLERVTQPMDHGGHRALWRKLPAGYIAPIYDAKQGVDARLLSEAWGGYGFKKQQEIQ